MGKEGLSPFNELQKQLQLSNKNNRSQILHQHHLCVLQQSFGCSVDLYQPWVYFLRHKISKVGKAF